MQKKAPAYTLHKPSGKARVRIDGRDIYLGPYGSDESRIRYDEEIARWQRRQFRPLQNSTIGQLTVGYLQRCVEYYVKDGEPTSEIDATRLALKYLNRSHRGDKVAEFTPMMLETVREKMVDAGYVRDSINRHVGRIVRCFKWGVSRGLVPVDVYQALTTLEGLREGRTKARESVPVPPAPERDIFAIETAIPRPLWGAVQFQMLTAARPGEALTLRLCDIDRTGEVWVYRPVRWKTQHRGKSRLILIGPKAQELIREFTSSADASAYLFAVPGSEGRSAYKRHSYTVAVRRACVKVEVPVWKPNQLRHSAATNIRAAAKSDTAAGVEISKTILGHSELRMTEIYAERDLNAAREVIARIG